MAQKLNTGAVITVAAAGTAVTISATEIPVTSVIIEADASNTGNIYIGDSSVDATNGITAVPGESINVSTDDIPRQADEFILSDIFVDADTNDNKARIAYVKRR